jgi:parafibromin
MGEKPSKPKLRKTIDNEKLFTNLVTVVDKRRSTKDTEQNAQLVEALNPEGFRVTAELLATFREKTQTIINNEIPVGNSASILKAAAGKDLSRILKLYMETLQPPKSSKSGSAKDSSITSSGQKKSFRPYLVGKKPIIIVPKGMTAILTLINAHEFFSNSAYVPREVMTKQKAKSGQMTIKTTFQRRVGQRLGGGMVEYELMDNPKSKLPTSKDWDRVVAVVALGHSWQFKDWPGYYSNPVKLFNSTFGFYVGMEGAKLPPDLQGWSVVHGKLNRDKRGMDSVTHASFWNGLDEFMAIHKPEMLPQPET